LNFRDDVTIIHNILEFGAILQPFLNIPNPDLERRDPKERPYPSPPHHLGLGHLPDQASLTNTASGDGKKEMRYKPNAELEVRVRRKLYSTKVRCTSGG